MWRGPSGSLRVDGRTSSIFLWNVVRWDRVTISLCWMEYGRKSLVVEET